VTEEYGHNPDIYRGREREEKRGGDPNTVTELNLLLPNGALVIT